MFGRFARMAGAVSGTAARRMMFSAAVIGSVAVGSSAFASSSSSSSIPSLASVLRPTVAQAAPAKQLPPEGIPGTNYERTFIAIKPDGVQRQLIGKIIERFEQKGFTLVAMKLLVPTKEMAEGHYDDLKSKPFFRGLTNFFSSGPVIAMVWQGKGAIKTGRKLLGETDPAKSPPGSIRGDFSIDIGRNICHGSDGPEGAKHEIGFWFDASEIYDWSSAQSVWVYEKP